MRDPPRSLACGRGWTPGPRTRRWSAPPASRLVEHGLPEERLTRFPADQVILLDEKRELEVRFDDVMKTMNFPFWQVEALAAQIKVEEAAGTVRRCPAAGFTPRPPAQGAIDQRIALLRHVEALRLYAAEHDGTLPAKLSDVPVPLPVDPFTGKPFRYEVTGNTAHLRGTPPPGQEKDPTFNIHYEVTVAEVESSRDAISVQKSICLIVDAGSISQ